ncbi:holin [Streptomyces sp. WMMC897]|uniref:holin n=1 Tax=Streptomyces sp. WMMC897 TaxID=3014782 RepID=UPI0022B68F44|nr:holin [Streptomyces sp. WMMC897]MCZ7414301.1 holin [Streptomyces sp. WMMC897]
MPSRAPRPCTTPGCPGTPVPPSAKCLPCQGRARRPRPSAHAQGYTAEHRRRFRAAVLDRDPVCVLCGQAPSVHADHWPMTKRELRAQGLDEHDPERGRGLCASCHSSETAKYSPGGWNTGARY